MIFEKNGVQYSKGSALPFGPSSPAPNTLNFSINSKHATSCTLVLYHMGAKDPYVEITLPKDFQTGHNFAITVYNINIEETEYGFRFDGPSNAAKGLLFNPNTILMDPYSYGVKGHSSWSQYDYPTSSYKLRSYFPTAKFDWEDDQPLHNPLANAIIYEAHIRSFTKDFASDVDEPGTYNGFKEKIPYLKKLGVNCVELLPIFDFNEREFDNQPHRKILNLWGYSPISFFAPKESYGSINDLKALIKELHKNNIEVLLDVVYNHTGEFAPEGKGKPLIYSFRGIDNPTYYMLKEDGTDYNFSGCFNSFNTNHPLVKELIIASLRHWVTEYHIDGFRFDLASALTRDQKGEVLTTNNLLETIAQDPILANTKLIAEPWDALGLYQMGNLPAPDCWSQWNDIFRNSLRSYLVGDDRAGRDLVKRIQGSPLLFKGKGQSINFVTCHDGFTLLDLNSYTTKHNWANGDKNKDGSDWNIATNHGVEGPTSDPHLLSQRKKAMKNAQALLLISRGVPMLLAGDEFANSQKGNNNGYCQDNPISWLNWTDLENNQDIFHLVQRMTALRLQHPVLRYAASEEPSQASTTQYAYPELSFHGTIVNDIHLEEPMLTFAALFVETAEKYPVKEDSFIYVGTNQYKDTQSMELPPLPEGFVWRKYVDTSEADWGEEAIISDTHYQLETQAVVVLTARKEK